jgi:hypothetical protein
MKELDVEITGKEKYKVESDLVGTIVAVIAILMLILGIAGGDFAQGMVLALVCGGITYKLGNLLYIFTPFYHRKTAKRDKIYQYFKNRFYQLNEFSPEKYSKTAEEIFNTERKSADDIMFDIYMKAYQCNADGVIINDVNQYSKNCVFVNEK